MGFGSDVVQTQLGEFCNSRQDAARSRASSWEVACDALTGAELRLQDLHRSAMGAMDSERAQRRLPCSGGANIERVQEYDRQVASLLPRAPATKTRDAWNTISAGSKTAWMARIQGFGTLFACCGSDSGAASCLALCAIAEWLHRMASKKNVWRKIIGEREKRPRKAVVPRNVSVFLACCWLPKVRYLL